MITSGLRNAMDYARTFFGEPFYVILDNYIVAVACSPGVDICLLKSLFGNACDVSRKLTQPMALGHWRFVALELGNYMDLWEEVRKAIREAPKNKVRRWFGDRAFPRYDFTWGYILVHSADFNSITVCVTGDLSIFYFYPKNGLNIPHFEHTLKYPLRVEMRRGHYIQAHGATAVYRNKGLAFMGRRRSGKSTMLMHLVMDGGAIVGNDLSFIDIGSVSPKLVAFPHQTRLALGTIQGDPELHHLFEQGQFVTDNYPCAPVFNEGKFEIYYNAMVQLFGHDPMIRRFEFHAIVFPVLDLSLDESTYIVVDKMDAKQRVEMQLRLDPALPDWIPIYRDLEEFESRNISRFVENLPPTYELRFGGKATRPLDSVQEIVDLL